MERFSSQKREAFEPRWVFQRTRSQILSSLTCEPTLTDVAVLLLWERPPAQLISRTDLTSKLSTLSGKKLLIACYVRLHSPAESGSTGIRSDIARNAPGLFVWFAVIKSANFPRKTQRNSVCATCATLRWIMINL